MQIAPEKVVHIHYTLKNVAGELLDKSSTDEPLGYLHGAGNIIPGLEDALAGKSAGDAVSVRVTPEQGYGTRDESLVQDVPRGAFEGVDTIEPGMRFQAESEDGARVILVVSVSDDVVTVDGNHPLAGETLMFDVEVDAVRDASPVELEHGHVHADGDDSA
jgi:FKBP-type peptidyl-prolyl cis-trans isomerase SlyD